jgi:hypothetical protein
VTCTTDLGWPGTTRARSCADGYASDQPRSKQSGRRLRDCENASTDLVALRRMTRSVASNPLDAVFRDATRRSSLGRSNQRITERNDRARARGSLDRHGGYFLAAYVARV